MSVNFNIKNYKKTLISSGITGCIGLIGYELYRFKKAINNMVQSTVLDIEKKGPEYIYIKYHVYRESLKQMKEIEEEKNNMINVMVHPVSKWWKAMEHSIAWRLLEIAKKGDQSERTKAIQQLVVIDHLKDWDFQHLAQLCDDRTAVSLARSNCDLRWFLKPKMQKVLKNPKILLKEIQKLFEEMTPNKCINYFMNSLFNINDIKEPHTDDLFVSHGDVILPQELDLLRKCVEEFLHLSTNVKYSQEIIEKGGLLILMELLKIFQSDEQIRFLICEIISNFTLCSDKLYDFFATGWIRILAEWSRDDDIKIKCIAAKALTNLDRDDTNNFIYNHKIFPLYPTTRLKKPPEADIVFIHGLLGSVFYTWRQKDRPDSEKNGHKKLQDSDQENRSKQLEQINKMSDLEAKVKLENISYDHNRNDDDHNNILTNSDFSLNNKITNFYKEIIQSLSLESELSSDWEVVYADCPVKSNPECRDPPCSVSGANWLNEEQNNDYSYCWPMEWLPKDFPNVRVLGCNYESYVSQWSVSVACSCDKQGGQLLQRGREFLEYLAQSKVGQNNRPVIFVGHSLGGLIAKTIIVQSLESIDPDIRAIGENTKAILFLGTPHKGASVLKWKQHTQLLLSPTLEVVELVENAKHLLVLNDKFLSLIEKMENHNKQNIDIVSILEGLPTVISIPLKLSYVCVPENTASLGKGEIYILNEDHLSICKPILKQSFLYQRLLKMIDGVLKDKKLTVR